MAPTTIRSGVGGTATGDDSPGLHPAEQIRAADFDIGHRTPSPTPTATTTTRTTGTTQTPNDSTGTQTTELPARVITTPTTGAERPRRLLGIRPSHLWVYLRRGCTGTPRRWISDRRPSGLPVTLAASGACTLADATLGLVIASDVGSCSGNRKATRRLELASVATCHGDGRHRAGRRHDRDDFAVRPSNIGSRDSTQFR